MYLFGGETYYTPNGQQHTRQNAFLLLTTTPGLAQINRRYQVRALIRQVALHQVGHWMMGTAMIGGRRWRVSGAYGHDGLLLDLPPELWQLGLPLPDVLYDAWNTGGGHNSIGREAPALRQWALDNWNALIPESERFPQTMHWAEAYLRLLTAGRTTATYRVERPGSHFGMIWQPGGTVSIMRGINSWHRWIFNGYTAPHN